MDSIENKNIGWQRVLLLIIPYVITVGIFQGIGFLITGTSFDDMENIPIRNKLYISIFDMVGTFLVLWGFMSVVENEKLFKLGFSLQNRFKDCLLGFGLGVFILVFGFFYLLLSGNIDFNRIVFDPIKLGQSFALFLIVAVVEESLIRGYVLRNLMISFNKYLALILSSLIFSLMHGLNPNFNNIAFVNIFLAGILLGITYIHTQNLWFPIMLHFSWNFFQTNLGFNVSGQDSYSFVEIDLVKKNLFNGGEFGFEGSILCIIIQSLIIISMVIFYAKKQQVKTVQKI